MFKWLCKRKLRKVLEEYLKVHNLAANTVRLTKQAWGQMVEQCGDVRLVKFTESMAESIQVYWQHNASDSTARIYRKTVSPVFTWCVRRKYLKKDPFARLRIPKPTKRNVRVYEPQEFKRLLLACGDIRWVAILLIARTTGMRKSTIQNLCRDDICFESEILCVQEKFETDSTWKYRPKDKEERKLPLVPQVARVLTELLYMNPTNQPYVLLKPSRYYHLLEMRKLGLLTDEMRLHPFSNFDRKFRKIQRAAGVKGRFHDLRATCLTDLANVLNPKELALIGGHSDIDTTMRYIGTGRDTVDKARDRVNESLMAVMTPSQALYPT